MIFNRKICLLIITSFISLGQLLAQTDEVSKSNYFQRYLNTFTVGGYYRGFFYGRQMGVPYGSLGENKVLSATDPSYFDPMLFLYLGGNPTPTTSFGFDLNIINFLNGPSSTNTNFLNNYQTSTMRGSMDINGVGKFNVILGGIEWTRLSTFTFGDNVRYNRYSVFDRRPWDPGGNIKSRYGSYYYDGTFQQDVRFGTRAFKGLLVNGWLAHKLRFDLYYGKAAVNGGINPPDYYLPKHDVAFKLTKDYSNGEVSINTYNSIINTDSTNANTLVKQQFNMFTASIIQRTKYANFSMEAGMGGYESPTIKRSWSPAVIADVTLSKKLTGIPISLRGYYIGQYFINRNSSVSNVTIGEANSGFKANQGAGTFLPVGQQLTGVGDLVNNRQGGNINTEFNIGSLKVILGNEISADINRLAGNDSLTYVHRINGLQWSRFVQFPNTTGNYGPNKRVNSFYRGVYETAGFKLTDDNGNLLPMLKYNSADIQLKYKQTLLGRDLYVFNLNSFSSTGHKFSPIPRMNDKSLIQAFYHELEFYYNIHKSVMLDFYLGYERIKGNKQTDQFLGADGITRGRDQKGKAIGTGFDLFINSTTNLYFRYRWFNYKDKSIESEKFKGREATIELKIFF